jgi:hypothetical protein
MITVILGGEDIRPFLATIATDLLRDKVIKAPSVTHRFRLGQKIQRSARGKSGKHDKDGVK